MRAHNVLPVAADEVDPQLLPRGGIARAFGQPLGTDYVEHLDGLRGLAVLAVLLFHFDLHLVGGFLGVDLFFVLMKLGGSRLSSTVYM